MLEKIVKISPGNFRLLLAVSVMIYHSTAFLAFGHAMVYMFFMLSGYWIFRMYEEKYSTFKSPYLVYIQSRFFRLYPVYLLILAISVFSFYFLSDQWPTVLEKNKDSNLAVNFINNVLVLPNSFVKGFWYIVPAWSLSVELQFYIFAPLLLLILKNKTWSVVLVVASSVFCMVGSTLKWSIFEIESLLIFLPYFLIGGLIYTLNLKVGYAGARNSLLLAVLLTLVTHAIPSVREAVLSTKTELYGLNVRKCFNLLLAVSTIPFIIFNIRQPVQNRDRDMLASSISFVIYLLHWPFLAIYATSVRNVGIVQKTVHILLYWIISFVVSYFISKYYDQYLESKRRKWLKGKPTLEIVNAN